LQLLIFALELFVFRVQLLVLFGDQRFQSREFEGVEIRKGRALSHRERSRSKQIPGKSILDNLHSHLWIVAANQSAPVDPFQQHRKLCLRQGNGSTRRLRPDESPWLPSLREKT
jgi:hypothetical protein